MARFVSAEPSRWRDDATAEERIERDRVVLERNLDVVELRLPGRPFDPHDDRAAHAPLPDVRALTTER
jgi:hypothetical protein